jgi:hypothetical protein
MTLEEASQLLSNWITKNPVELATQKAAVEQYGKLFRPENIDNLTEAQFKAFLLFKNNKHWSGIHRQPNIYADLDRLKTTLKVLLDEAQPIQVRLDKITDGSGPLYIRGLGRAVLTPILMCVYPDKYAVYNRRRCNFQGVGLRFFHAAAFRKSPSALGVMPCCCPSEL